MGGGGRLCTYRYTVTTRMTSALRWAAMRAILMFQLEVTDKVPGQCPQTRTFFEEKGEPKRYRTEVLPLTILTPYREAKPAHWGLKKGEKVKKKKKYSPRYRHTIRFIFLMVHTNPYGASRCGSAHHGGKQMLSQACPGSAVSHKLRVQVKVAAVRCRSWSRVLGAVAPLCRPTPLCPLDENNTRRRSVHHVKHVPSVSTFSVFVCSFVWETCSVCSQGTKKSLPRQRIIF